jgi:hypothetical protein
VFTRYNFSIAGLLPSDEESLIPSAAGLYVSPTESQPSLFDAPDGMVDAESFTPFIMDRESSLKIAKCIPKRNPEAPENSMVMLDVATEAENESTVAISESIRRAIFKSIKVDATKFPDIDSVLPDNDSAAFTIRFSTDVLVPVLNAFKRFCSEDEGIMTMRVYGADKGVRIDATACGQVMTAIVMPRRDL